MHTSRCSSRRVSSAHGSRWPALRSQRRGPPRQIHALREHSEDALQERDYMAPIPGAPFNVLRRREGAQASTSASALLDDIFEVPWDAVTAIVTTIQLVCAQVVLGFGATPLLASAFTQIIALVSPSGSGDPGELGGAIGAATSQVLFLLFVTRQLTGARERANAELVAQGFPEVAPTSEYRFDASAVALGSAVAATALGAAYLLQAAQGPEMARTAVEMAALVRGGDVAAIVATGAATAVLAPLAEERVYRGFVLGSMLSPICHLRVNVHLAVAIQATLFAGSHLSTEAFPSLWVFGALLGYSYVLSKGNLLVPTLGHAAFNGAIFAAIVVNSAAL